MAAPHRRGPWSQTEDAYLMNLVQTQGALNWVRIANILGSRTPKQCRERYHQNLKPTLNHEPITPEEGMVIERLVGEIGKRWAEIARRLHGRSDNAVKNWWNGSQNRRKRMDRRKVAHMPYDRDMNLYRPVGFSAPTRLPHPGTNRPLPPPLHASSLYAAERSRYDTPLPSPYSTNSDASTSPTSTSSSSLSPPLSDSSCPRSHEGSSNSDLELPPIDSRTSAASSRSSNQNLPSLSAITSPLYPHSPDAGCRAPPSSAPPYSTCFGYMSPPKTHLPTAPSSPVSCSPVRSHFAGERTTRVPLANLIH